MLGQAVCLSSVSKDIEGEIGDPEGERRECREPRCATLTTTQPLTLKLGSNQDCDSLGGLLDGLIEVRDLVQVYDTDGNQRGFHSGRFRWESGIGLIFGELSGVTNAGTHRPPAFGECQRCRDAVMEGQLRGKVCRAREARFAGCQIFGAYRIRIDPGAQGIPQQRVVGTFEGVLVCPCRSGEGAVSGEEPGAVRLVFAYEGEVVRLVSRQPVEVVVPPSDPVTGYEAEQGFWVETRAADETTLHRRILPDPFSGDVEVFSDDPQQSMSRSPVAEPSGSFTVLVPAEEEADHVALFSSAAAAARARAEGGPEVAALPAVQVARFSLWEEER